MAPSSQTLPTVSGLSLQAKQSFRAFNTDVAITLADWRDSGRLARVEAFFHDFELRFSRFFAVSELRGQYERAGQTARLFQPLGRGLDDAASRGA